MSLVDSLDLPPPPDSLPPPPPLRLPTLVSTYSHLPDRSISHDDASMAYYRRGGAPIDADLRYGLERRIERDDAVEEHLDGLCESLRAGGERPGGVVTWRGMMTRIMTAPYEDREGWEMNAIALNGSVYLELDDPAEARLERAKQQSRWAEQSYMGYAYEAYSTTTGEEPPHNAPEGWSGDVNTNVQWCCVVRTAIGDVPMCIGGEVDCVQAPVGAENPGLEAYVELKTNKVIDSDRADAVFHKKLLKHWAQSYLLGVPTVEVGFRDDSILVSQHTFTTSTIPDIVASTPRPAWHPSPCLHFLHATLSMLTSQVLLADPRPPGEAPLDPAELPDAVLWKLRFTPRRGIELFHVGSVPNVNARWGGILPIDYVRWRLCE